MNNRMVQDFVLKDKEIFVGLEDSKKTWKIAVRSDRTVIDRTAMEAKYPLLIRTSPEGSPTAPFMSFTRRVSRASICTISSPTME